MGSRERPHDETIMVAYKSFERKAWHMLMVTSSFVVIMNSCLLPITEEVCGWDHTDSYVESR